MEKQLLGISLILFGILLNSSLNLWLFVSIPVGLWGLIIVIKEYKKSKAEKKDIVFDAQNDEQQ